MAKRFHGSYEGKEGKAIQEAADSMMISSGAGAHANMPQEVVMREYPKVGGFLPEGLDDSIKGVDGQVGADNSKKNSKLAPKKV